MAEPIYKILSDEEWNRFETAGSFDGAPVDLEDGYIHLSAVSQVAETAAKHFAGRGDLRLVAIDPAALGEALRWEPSRGDALFPHLYGTLPASAVIASDRLPLGEDGRHRFDGLLTGRAR